MNPFAPSHRVIEAGIAKALEGASLSAPQLQRLGKHYPSAAKIGDPRAERRALGKALQDEPWAWPALEQWDAAFTAADVWPLLWSQLGLTHGCCAAPVHGGHFELLSRHIMFCVFAIRDAKQRFGLDDIFSYALVRGDERCSADAWIVGREGPRILAGDLSTVPPFFPGDACRLRPYIPGRQRPDGSRVSDH